MISSWNITTKAMLHIMQNKLKHDIWVDLNLFELSNPKYEKIFLTLRSTGESMITEMKSHFYHFEHQTTAIAAIKLMDTICNKSIDFILISKFVFILFFFAIFRRHFRFFIISTIIGNTDFHSFFCIKIILNLNLFPARKS